MLSWSISAASMLTMPERQALLEESDVTLRLALATELLEEEIRTMSALPSLPALGIGRNSWSPN
ncbi:LON peptidase substrate-binding domain-containing protein [Nocardioides alcanivorans]|nr:LON peptidase substrate-binding domain-containing protein [Nocardioides alcanivorans]